MGTWINIGTWLRDMTCSHPTTATHTQAFSEPHPHVTSRTVCLVCGKAVTPRQRVADDVIESMLMGAARKADRET